MRKHLSNFSVISIVLVLIHVSFWCLKIRNMYSVKANSLELYSPTYLKYFKVYVMIC